MSESLSRQVAEVFAAIAEDDLAALHTLDRFEADRIEARRRYEECDRGPLSPGSLPSGH